MARRYWFTVHWPRQVREEDWSPYVWLQEDKVDAARGMAKGDYVAVYEYADGPSELLDGEWHHRQEGAQAVIFHGRVVKTHPRASEARVFWRYGGEYPMTWIPYAELKITRQPGASREAVNRILGYVGRYTLRGFGRPKYSGIREVTREQYRQLIRP